ncbi:hypothetical protein [Alienimonas californiensis]|uniref:Uncharacterized protein n=1 Tax=Alienimonas californiensis TaxID=2527989 RepID=A0A517P7U1_9PLAN|nr:hypothetical protein [Alienimonas californiensis]QDT15448.1 hypothetical protein CA12_15330 [Alienimonas californiensis]
MDLLADDFALSPPALALLAAYDAAVKQAAKERAAQAAAAGEASDSEDDSAADEADADELELDEEGEEVAAPSPSPARTPIAVPRLAPHTVADADDRDRDDWDDDGDAADLHGLLLAAGALDVDLSNVAAGVRYRVTRSGRGLLAKAA